MRGLSADPTRSSKTTMSDDEIGRDWKVKHDEAWRRMRAEKWRAKQVDPSAKAAVFAAAYGGAGLKAAEAEDRAIRALDEKLAANYKEEEELPEKKYTCEADKPEGTRDVEKFLKEQQQKLWTGE